jgi:hypothetical protein
MWFVCLAFTFLYFRGRILLRHLGHIYQHIHIQDMWPLSALTLSIVVRICGEGLAKLGVWDAFAMVLALPIGYSHPDIRQSDKASYHESILGFDARC